MRFVPHSLHLVILFLVLPVHAENHQGPWQRHTIDNSSKGADGARLADANGDGLMDIATGWEEGGVVRLYLNPGPEKAKEKWPAVTVGRANNVEDAVMVDLDNDGAIDIVSSCEGKTMTMYVHWGPKDKKKLLDEDAWQTEPIPATVGKQMWMYCLPMEVDGEHGPDMIVGSKGKGAAVGWLRSPESPRDLKAWEYEKIEDAGWIMSIEKSVAVEGSNASILITDRKGSTRGVYQIGYMLDSWCRHDFELEKSEYMFAYSEERMPWAIATRDGITKLISVNHWLDHVASGSKLRSQSIPNPFGTKHGKAVAIGKIDTDETSDIVVSFNTQGQKNKPGVAWIKVLPDKAPEDWPAYDVAGLEGKKFDRLELIDLDGDGDLDVLTCEEADNLGVIWYENPYGKADKE